MSTTRISGASVVLVAGCGAVVVVDVVIVVVEERVVVAGELVTVVDRGTGRSAQGDDTAGAGVRSDGGGGPVGGVAASVVVGAVDPVPVLLVLVGAETVVVGVVDPCGAIVVVVVDVVGAAVIGAVVVDVGRVVVVGCAVVVGREVVVGLIVVGTLVVAGGLVEVVDVALSRHLGGTEQSRWSAAAGMENPTDSVAARATANVVCRSLMLTDAPRRRRDRCRRSLSLNGRGQPALQVTPALCDPPCPGVVGVPWPPGADGLER